MPNWTQNEVSIRGEQEHIDAFRGAVRGQNGSMDFDRLEPMPERLDIESGSDTELGMACWEDDPEAFGRSLRWIREQYPGVTSAADLRALLQEHEPAVVELGRQAIENMHQYGAQTWYEWRGEHWGTKWNACHIAVEAYVNCVAYRFDTAWDAPRPLVGKLVDLAHSLGLLVVWDAKHEDGGSEVVMEE